MQSVSAAFTTAIKKLTRWTKGKIDIVWTDATIDPTITATSNDDNYGMSVVKNKQCADGNSLATHRWFHLDGVCNLSGNYYVAPDDTSAASHQMGWWGATRCNGSAVWSGTYPTLTLTFGGVDGRPVLTLMVTGDQIYNEFPVDFDIKVYGALDPDTPVLTKTITNNALLNWSESITPINDVVKMELILKKWSAPNRVAKILEFYTSISASYTGDDIVSMNLLEEREISDGSLPVGNISSNELDVELQNISMVQSGVKVNDPFSYENSRSTLENVLKINRKITAWIGVVLADDSTEWVKLGTFWSGDWDSSEKSSTVKTSARDRMELLRKGKFAKSLIYSNVTLYDLMETVLNDAKTSLGMSDLAWSIDTELQSYTIPVAYFPVQNYFQCIRQIIEACQGQAYMSRDDILIVTGPSFPGNSTGGYMVTKDDYFDREQPAKSSELKNSIRVPISKLTIQTEDSEAYKSESITLAKDAEITLNIDYRSYPVSTPTGALSSESLAGMTITAEVYYACSAVVTIKNNGATSGIFVLIISGKKYDLNSDELVEASDSASIKEYGTLEYPFPPNHLIQYRTIGGVIADSLLASYKDFRKDMKLNWCGNPALELGDLVDVPIYQRGVTATRGNFLIFKNKLDFDGTLQSTTEGRFKSYAD
jgi:hypothetical protein